MLVGVAVLAVEAVMPLGRFSPLSLCKLRIGGISGMRSSLGGGIECFFCPPNENVRLARSKKLDLDPPRLGGGCGCCCGGCLVVYRWLSSCAFPAPKSVEDGAVEALLCRDELSVDVAFVVFETPLPLELR